MTERRWVPFELHSHSVHSDGDFTVSTLLENARSLGYAGIALTDHNTRAGLPEARAVAERLGLSLLGGMEWTTFFGHVLLLGEGHFDWRGLGKGNLSAMLRGIREAGTLVGAAHPFRPGSPFCTGCFWDFETDWTLVDYIEVWSGSDPSARSENRRALRLWKDLLNAGHRIWATAGRDWHREGPAGERVAATFLPAGSDPLTSLRDGEAVLSYGPVLELSVRRGDDPPTFHIDALESGWGLAMRDLSSAVVRVDSDGGMLAEFPLSLDPGRGENRVSFKLPAGGFRWATAELWGRFPGSSDDEDYLIALSNPVFDTTR